MKSRSFLFSAGLALGAISGIAQPIGLVLSGGGAKGAYQVGVWETLLEHGIARRIGAISGTSVGAINAALFATCSETDRIERVWLESLPKILTENKDHVGCLLGGVANSMYEVESGEMKKELKRRAELSAVDVSELTKEEVEAVAKEVYKRSRSASLRGGFERILEEARLIVDSTNNAAGFVDNAPLRAIIRNNIPEEWPEGAPSAYATALSKGTWNLDSWRLDDMDQNQRVDALLASTAIPGVFPSVDIDGEAHVDGGWEGKGGDYAPIKTIVENHPEIREIIIVYLNSSHHIKNRIRREDWPGVEIVEIVPSHDIGRWFTGSLNFDTSKAKRLINLGRKDAENVLKKAGL